MNIVYWRCSIDNIDILTDTRITVLRAANGLDDSVDMSEVRAQTYEYYKKALPSGEHIAFVAVDIDGCERIVGTGGISFYSVMPTYHLPSGRKGYIMNMYTDPEYRRRGIARYILSLLIEDAHSLGVEHITLEATPMGRPLYESYGFSAMQDEMIL